MSAIRMFVPFGLAFWLTGCGPPWLETSPGYVPEVADLESHIACELKPLVASIREDKKGYYLATRVVDGYETVDTDSEKLRRLVFQHPVLVGLLPKLVEYSFIASVSMVVDVLDTEGVSPSLSFIQPFNATASYNQTLSIGASLNGTQEHSQTYNYTINMAKFYSTAHTIDCSRRSPSGGLEGDLGLVEDVVTGLLSLDASAEENIAGSSSPIVSSATAEFSAPQKLEFSGTITKTTKKADGTTETTTEPANLTLNLDGGFTVQPPAPGLQGTLTLTGSAADDAGFKYFVSLTGSTYEKSVTSNLPFSITGNLTDNGGPLPILGLYNKNVGINPKLTLAGSIDVSDAKNFTMKINSGSITPDSNVIPNGTVSTMVLTSQNAVPKLQKRSVRRDYTQPLIVLSSAGSSNAGAAKASSSGAGASSGATQFSSYLNFQISYGLNGGPNWTLLRFKGPTGSSSLVTANRSDSDSLTITLSAACRQGGQNILHPKDFWQAIPVCDSSGTLESLAGINGQNFNTFRTR